jgi:quercetin dioxygenase-like cupin family protein
LLHERLSFVLSHIIKEIPMNATDLTAQILPLNELVAYQDGSVVSRTLLDKKVGTLTLFAFGAGQGLSEHTAPYDATIQVIDGEAEVIIEGTSYAVKSGEMIIMPANRPHAVRANEPFKMLLTMIRA